MNTELLSTHTPELFQKAVQRAADLLRAGEVVALPTETVYGLAANALDEKAVAKIFQIKGRPAHNPIIVHITSNEMAAGCVAEWPELATQLSRAFWPGPLTLVLDRSRKAENRGQRSENGDRRTEISGQKPEGGSKSSAPGATSDLRPPTSAFQIPALVTAGGETVGVRWPGHPFMQAVIRECGFPLAAPSANLSNQVSPTNAGHVRAQLDGKIPLIVDGGQAQVGIESTVLDLTVTPPRVLRPGMIHEESLAAVCGKIQNEKLKAANKDDTLRSPGMLAKHYSPKAKLVVLDWQNDTDLQNQIRNLKFEIRNCFVVAHTKIPADFGAENISVIPHDAEAYARALYGELHRCDAAGAKLIVMETPPETPEWSGIADRLRRAAA